MMTPDAIPHDVDVAARAGANVINDPGDAPDVTTTPGDGTRPAISPRAPRRGGEGTLRTDRRGERVGVLRSRERVLWSLGGRARFRGPPDGGSGGRPGGGQPGARVWHPARCAGPDPGGGGPRSRVGRRARRVPGGPPRGPERASHRCRSDARDGRARPPERGRRRVHERRVPRGTSRGAAGRGCVGRRRDE